MKKFILYPCMCVLLFILPGYAEDQTTVNFRNILTDLDRLILSKPNSELAKRFMVIKSRTESRDMVFKIDKNLSKNILEGAGFTPKSSDSSETFIVVSPQLINVYDKKPSIVLTILFHEFMHAYSYFENPAYFVFYSKNRVDKFLYEFDALFLEALFIDTYLIPNKFKLTKFEMVLHDSYLKKDLITFLRYTYSYDYSTAFAFYKIRMSKQNNDKKVADLEKMAEQIMAVNSLKEVDTDFDKFNKYIIISTYINFIDQVVFDILEMDEKTRVEPAGFSLKAFPRLNELKTSMSNSVTKKEIQFCANSRDKFYDKYIQLE